MPEFRLGEMLRRQDVRPRLPKKTPGNAGNTTLFCTTIPLKRLNGSHRGHACETDFLQVGEKKTEPKVHRLHGFFTTDVLTQNANGMQRGIAEPGDRISVVRGAAEAGKAAWARRGREIDA